MTCPSTTATSESPLHRKRQLNYYHLTCSLRRNHWQRTLSQKSYASDQDSVAVRTNWIRFLHFQTQAYMRKNDGCHMSTCISIPSPRVQPGRWALSNWTTTLSVSRVCHTSVWRNAACVKVQVLQLWVSIDYSMIPSQCKCFIYSTPTPSRPSSLTESSLQLLKPSNLFFRVILSF